MKKVVKKQRTSQRIALLYSRKEGALNYPENTGELSNDPKGRPARIFQIERKCFRLLEIDKYLHHAVFRWVVVRCRSLISAKTYCNAFRRWLKITNRLCLSAQTDVSPRALSEFLFELEGQGFAQRTVASTKDVLRSWFSWLFDRDLIKKPPFTKDILRCFRVDQNRIERGSGIRQALSKTEGQSVVDWAITQASPVAGFAVLLQMISGLRSHEVARLEKRHLTEKEGVFSLAVPGKGNKQRKVFLEVPVVEAYQRYAKINRHQGNRGPLLVAPGGGHFTTRVIQGWAKQAAVVVARESDISSHDLRRTAITLLIDHGATTEQAQIFAGHSSPRLTNRCYITRRPKMTATSGMVSPSKSQEEEKG